MSAVLVLIQLNNVITCHPFLVQALIFPSGLGFSIVALVTVPLTITTFRVGARVARLPLPVGAFRGAVFGFPFRGDGALIEEG